MNKIPESESGSQSSTSYVCKKEHRKKENEKTPFSVQSTEFIKIECSVPEKTCPNTFVDVSKAPRDTENDILSEIHPQIQKDDPLSTASDKQNKRDMKVTTVWRLKPSYVTFSDEEDDNTRLSLCTLNCHMKIPAVEQKLIFDTFWGKKTSSERLSFLDSSSEVSITPNGCSVLVKYHLDTTKGRQSICKRCFRNLLQVSNSYIRAFQDKRTHEFRQENIQKGKLIDKFPDPNCKGDDWSDDGSEDQESSENESNNGILSFPTDKSPNSSDLSKKLNFKKKIQDIPLREMKLLQGWTRITPCRSYCYYNVTEEDQKNIFYSYWQTATADSRQKFICNMSRSTYKNKRLLNSFFLNTKIGIKKVCCSCFCLAISESRHFVCKLLKKNWRKVNGIQELENEKPKSISSPQKDVDVNFMQEQEPVSEKWETPSIWKNDLKPIPDHENSAIPIIDLEDNSPEVIDVEDEEPKKISDVEMKKAEIHHSDIHKTQGSHEFLTSKLMITCLEMEAMKNCQNQDQTNISPSDVNVDSKLVLDQGDKSYLPLGNCIIKEEIDLENDSELQDDDKEPSDHISDFVTEDVKMECSIDVDNLQAIYDSTNSQISKNDSHVMNIVNKKIQDMHPPKKWRRLPQCSFDCHLKIDEKNQERNFNKYWQGGKGSYDFRYSFVNDMTDFQSNSYGKIQYNTLFYLEADCLPARVCRLCFRHVIGESDFFIQTVLDRKLQKVDETTEIVNNKRFRVKSNMITDFPFSNGNPDSSQNIEHRMNLEPEMKITSERRKANSTIDSLLEKNHSEMMIILDRKITNEKIHQKKVQRQKQKLNKKSSSFEEDSFSSEKTKKNARGKVNLQTRKVVKDNNKKKDSARILLSESKVPNYTRRKTSDQKLKDVMKQLVMEYTTNTKKIVNENDQARKISKDNLLKNTTKLFSSEIQVSFPTGEDIKKVEEHIKKFPLCESYHYNGQSTEKYLPMGLTIKVMYDLYKNEVSNPVSLAWYQKILGRTDLKFKLSFLTKCDKCNEAALQFKLAKDRNEKSKINSKRTAHLIDSEEANNSKSQDEKSENTVKSLMVCSFGFQQSLPTPFLQTPTAYYKQCLWTYNFTVQRQSKSKAGKHRKFYMWHEGEGKRSANEIASCLYQYLKSLPSNIKFIIFYSSSCNGDSRSKTLSTMFLHLIANHNTLQAVEHKFLVSGHSQIEENLGSNLTEEIMNNHHDRIQQPNDWYDAFYKHVQETDKSNVAEMAPDKFYDFESMRQDVFEGSEAFFEKDVKWLRYTKDGVFYKSNWSARDQFQILNFKRSFDLKSFTETKLQNIGSVYITEEKKKDLLDLLPLMKPEMKSFYEELPTEKNLLRKGTDQNISMGPGVQEKCEMLSPSLKRRLDEIDDEESRDLPQEICIIKKEECLGVSNPKFMIRIEEPPEKTCKNTCDESNSSEFEIVIVKEEPIEKNY